MINLLVLTNHTSISKIVFFVIYVSISDCFDYLSIETLEHFLLDCQKEVVDGKLWIALQANVLSDLNDTSVSFINNSAQ